MSNKGMEWRLFSGVVEQHIEQYVVQMYGDHPDKHIDAMSIEEVKGKMSSYVQRIGNAAKVRGKKDAMRDILKIAHFCCYTFFKMVEEYDVKPHELDLKVDGNP
jgi:hypothetical protein